MLNASEITNLNKRELEQARTFESTLSSAMQSFLSAYNLSHVWHSKYYFDGQYIDVSNDIVWKEIMVGREFYKDFINFISHSIPMNGSSIVTTSWASAGNKNQSFMDCIYQYGLKSGFNLILLHGDHIESYGFAGKNEIDLLTSGRLRQNDLEMICLYLKEIFHANKQFKNLVHGSTGEKFNIRKSLPFYQNTPIPTNFFFSCNNCHDKLSRQELLCLSYLTRGYGQKEIASILKIAPRTVEFHFKQIKDKFNNPPKSKLVTSFNNSLLRQIDPSEFMKAITRASNKS